METGPMNSASNKPALRIFIILLIISATLAAYWQLKGNGFVNFDDDIYITGNSDLQKGLTGESIKWAFSLSNKTSYWHPLTWLSLMADYELFGLDPTGYHLVNLLLHITNAVLLFLIFNRMTARVWPSAFVAALFALHPLNVESVAWAVERKTVLSTLFWMLSILAYLRYVNKPGISRYALLFLCMAVGLMSKTMLVSLPAVFLLLDFWPLGRLRFGNAAASDAQNRLAQPAAGDNPAITRLLLEKVPLLFLSVLFVAISIISLREAGTTIGAVPASFGHKCANALVSYVAYIVNMFWPAKLGVYYPLQPSYPFWQVAGSAVILAGITAAAIMNMKKRPWILMGWCWYLGIMFPVIGFVRDGLWPAMADRFAYLPLIGLFVIIAWSGEEIAARRPGYRKILCSAAFIAVIILAMRTRTQTSYWKDSISLFEHLEMVTPDNGVAYTNLGAAYHQKGDTVKADEYYRKEQKLNPESINSELLQVTRYVENGNLAAAAEVLKHILKKNDGSPQALYLMGQISDKSGDSEQAATYYSKVLLTPYPDTGGFRGNARNELQRLHKLFAPQLDSLKQAAAAHPADFKVRGELALRLDKLGMYDEALEQYLIMETLDRNSWQLFYNIGNVYGKLRRYPDSARYYEKSLALNRSNPDALNNLGIAFKQMKEYKQAISAFENAISVDDRFEAAPLNLATTYLQTGDRTNAIRYFKYTRDKFPHLTPKVMNYLKDLPESRK